ncbi:LAMI_0E08196g1_1 [Lachancea mirantina]|uniref:LAMI_0E08196g1_1 n=1 Tax=Lachancea mirantina TaxID=1230905 RepID=A0A1G4JMU9_9SACH|nr:LAMI_0E08196g1_1 [Lachancea mirantina]
MNVVPSSNFRSSVASNQIKGATSNAAPTLPDNLRLQKGALPLSSELSGQHPLENRVNNWDATQRRRQLEQYRQVFGIAEPIKREMELQIVEHSNFNPLDTTGQRSMHADILLNRDASVDWEDVYPSADATGAVDLGHNVHGQIEQQLRL